MYIYGPLRTPMGPWALKGRAIKGLAQRGPRGACKCPGGPTRAQGGPPTDGDHKR